MADPTPIPTPEITGPPAEINLELRPPGTALGLGLGEDWNLDQNFLAREQARDDARWQSILRGAGTAPGGGGGGTFGAEEKPSAIAEGLKAGLEAFKAGGKGIADFILPPGDPEQIGGPTSALKSLFNGLMSMGLSPLIGLGVGAGQALENAKPELAKTPIWTGTEALTTRALLAGVAVADLTEEERRLMSAPFTVREALETATQFAPAMFGPAAKGAKKLGAAYKDSWLASQRGAIAGEGGLPPKPPLSPTGETPPTVPPAEAPPAAPSPFAQGPKPRVNLARVGAEQAVKDLIAELNVKAQQEGKIKTEVIPHAETAARAEAKGLTIDQALKLNYESLHVNATALRDLRDFAFRELRATEILANGGDVKATERLPSMTVIAGLLEQRASATATDIGRGLSAFNILSDAERSAYDPGAIAALADQIQAGMLPGDTLGKRLAALGFKEQRKTFLRQLVLGAQRGQNIFYEAWINGLLSNPVSHAANTISNATVAAWGIAERQQAGMWNVVRGTIREGYHAATGQERGPIIDSEGVHPGEAVAMLRAVIQGGKDGTRLAWRGLMTGGTGFGGSGKQEIRPAIGVDLNFANPVGGFVDYLGTGIRLPSRLMMTEDAFFKGLNYRMELEALAYREGKLRGLSGDAFGDFRRAFVANPSAEVKVRAEQFALLQTFNKELTAGSFAGQIGMVGQQAQRLPLMRLVIPFMRTPVNIGEYAWQRTPVLSLISQQLYTDLAAGGAARDLALARLGTSAMLAAAFMEYSGAGLMTGAGADRKNAVLKQAEKALGRQDYSTRIGDELYRIDRLDPAGMTLGALATYAEIAGQIPEGHRLELAFGLVLAMSEAIKDKPYFLGLATAIEAVENPGKEAKTVIEKYARSMMPFSGFIHQVRKTGVPGLVEADQHKRITMALSEMEQLLNVMKDGIPGWSSTLPEDLNPITGEPILYPPGWGPDILSPIFVTRLQNDPVLAEIVRNKPSISPPPKAIAGRVPPQMQMQEDQGAVGVPLTPQEYHRLLVLQTREIRDGQGRTLHEALRDLVLSGEYQAYEGGPGSTRSAEIARIYNVFKRNAIEELRAESRRGDGQLDKAVEEILDARLKRKVAPATRGPEPIQIAPGMTLPGAGNLPATLGR